MRRRTFLSRVAAAPAAAVLAGAPGPYRRYYEGVLVSVVTGIVTLISLPKRRRAGLVTTLAGTVAVLVIYWLWVPR